MSATRHHRERGDAENGTGEANTTILVYDRHYRHGRCGINAPGLPERDIGTGGHSFAAKNQDWAGNTSAASRSSLTVVAAPSARYFFGFPDAGIAGDGMHQCGGADLEQDCRGEATP